MSQQSHPMYNSKAVNAMKPVRIWVRKELNHHRRFYLFPHMSIRKGVFTRICAALPG